MKATVDVRTTIEVDYDDAVVDEIMSAEWQSHFYTFRTREQAIAWLAWVVEEFNGPDHVDGLYQIGRVETRVLDQEQETVEVRVA